MFEITPSDCIVNTMKPREELVEDGVLPAVDLRITAIASQGVPGVLRAFRLPSFDKALWGSDGEPLAQEILMRVRHRIDNCTVHLFDPKFHSEPEQGFKALGDIYGVKLFTLPAHTLQIDFKIKTQTTFDDFVRLWKMKMDGNTRVHAVENQGDVFTAVA